MLAFLIIILALLLVALIIQIVLLQVPDDAFYIDDGIDHCKDCEICSKENCRKCIYNKFNR